MDLFGVGSIINGILGAGASILNTNSTNKANQRNVEATNEANVRMNRETNEANYKMVQETNALNREIANQNLAFQQSQQDYEKALQQQIFEREDSSYQRTVNDMRSAGLNPLTMNGTNSSGEAIALTPMNNSFQSQTAQFQSGHVDPFLKEAYDVQGLTSLFQNAVNVESSLESLKRSKLETKYYERQLSADTFSKYYDSIIKQYDSLSRQQKNKYDSYFGLTDGMTPEERRAAIVSRAFGLDTYSPPLSDFDSGSRLLGKGYERTYATTELASEVLDSILSLKRLLLK